MSIKTKFIIVTVVSLLATIMASFILFQNTSTTGKELERQGIINEIKNKIFEGIILRDDYLLYREERPLVQLEETAKTLDKLLTLASRMFVSADEQIAISNIVENKKFIDQALSQIIAKSSLRLEQQLMSQILIKSQDNIIIASRLADASRNSVTSSQQRTIFFVLILIGGISLIIIIALYFIWRSIGQPLIALKEAAVRISSLDFSATTTTTTTTTTPPNDEMGQLARAFNTMVGKLKESYTATKNANLAARNVLEDLQTEKLKLVETKLKDEALLQSIGDGVVATDQDGKIILINRAAEQMLGLVAEQVMGKLFVEAWKVLDEKGNLVSETERPVSIVLRGKTTITGPSYFYTKKNGTVFPVAITVTPVIVDNKIIGAVDVFRDITKEKEIEKLRTDFLSLASHQLRTPLSGTKWLIETMQKGITGKIEKKEKEYLDALYQMNDRMIKLVVDMLNVLRLESGSEAIKKEVISVSDLYKDLAVSMDSSAKSKWVVLKNALNDPKGTPKKIEIETDVQLLKTILECFVSNAINYTPSGKEVFLDAKEEKNMIIFSVKDSGIGIPEEEQNKIFERFYRASNAKAIKPEGTGLGLYIAKMLAEKIGGKIYFESKNGKGSTFILQVTKKVV